MCGGEPALTFRAENNISHYRVACECGCEGMGFMLFHWTRGGTTSLGSHSPDRDAVETWNKRQIKSGLTFSLPSTSYIKKRKQTRTKLIQSTVIVPAEHEINFGPIVVDGMIYPMRFTLHDGMYCLGETVLLNINRPGANKIEYAFNSFGITEK